mmetsp:Transcript_25858/g.67805  ORF Transcript_25858/g.67805 Transcript_25858/m.67805 type:complete len:207 (-) Transcript_25858:1428-2048(-)
MCTMFGFETPSHRRIRCCCRMSQPRNSIAPASSCCFSVILTTTSVKDHTSLVCAAYTLPKEPSPIKRPRSNLSQNTSSSVHDTKLSQPKRPINGLAMAEMARETATAPASKIPRRRASGTYAALPTAPPMVAVAWAPRAAALATAAQSAPSLALSKAGTKASRNERMPGRAWPMRCTTSILYWSAFTTAGRYHSLQSVSTSATLEK